MSVLRPLAALALLSSGAALAGDAPAPQALAAAADLFRLQMPRDHWNQLVTTMLATQLKVVQQEHADRPIPSEPEMHRVFDEVLPYDEMVGIGARIMARRFDVSEIEQIAAFYRSPVGRKSLEVMPLTMNDAMSEVGALVQKRMPAALERLNRAHGEGPAAPPPPAKTGSGSRPRGP